MELSLKSLGLKVAEVGNKALNLSKLINEQFSVPDGVVLSQTYFACSEAELQQKLNRLSERLERMLPSADGWAVRSTAIDEDGGTKSMAGQYKTVIIQYSTQLPAAVAEVHEGSIPVIIQTFIEPDYSGVLFSCNPLTGESEIIIELVEGRGEALVGGDANPMVHYREGRWSDSSPLFEQLLLHMEPWIMKAKELMRQQVDMEFCIKNKSLYWLQVRPVTTGVHTDSWDYDFAHIPDSFLEEDWFLLDQCTEPVTPLVKKLDPGNYFQMPYWDIRFVQHYPYISMKKNVGAAAPSQPDDGTSMLLTWQALRNRYEPIFDQQLNENITHASLEDLWEKTAVRVEINRSYVSEYLNRDWFMARRIIGKELEQLVSRYAGENADVPLLLSSLIGEVNTITYQKTLQLNQLVNSARKYPDFGELCNKVSSSEPHPWADQFAAFISQYGYELPHPLGLHLKTLAESPETLLSRITAELHTRKVSHEEKGPESWEEAAARIGQRMEHDEKTEFHRLLTEYRAYVIRTEDDDYLLQKGASSIRRILLEIAQRLVDCGKIESRESIFFLYPDEIYELISGSRQSVEETELLQREKSFAAAAAINPPLLLKPGNARKVSEDQKLQGVAVAQGCRSGKVFKLMNPLDRESYNLIPENAVIVAPILTPNLTYAILACAAIVTEVGGFLSHGAIFAREMGIPAIVQVEAATSLLQNGDEVQVDAKRGVIEILKRNSNPS
ncbi:PEP/pyruvate-binding domain-containing protein [Paenibacillus sp. FSL L8-0340]|uniref:PEP/pyruvate-binding domain-containing protein n=1 Tax=Paenibacillus sp. FSL L8-0340 TaxID=2954685 RepID=UPI003158247E